MSNIDYYKERYKELVKEQEITKNTLIQLTSELKLNARALNDCYSDLEKTNNSLNKPSILKDISTINVEDIINKKVDLTFLMENLEKYKNEVEGYKNSVEAKIRENLGIDDNVTNKQTKQETNSIETMPLLDFKL